MEALAKRQQELAAQSAQQQAFEQRWQEEQLRREAEELKQQMQQLAQNSKGQQSSSQQQSGQQSASSGRGQGATGTRNSQPEEQNRQMAEAMRQATSALQRAEDEMRKAVSDHDRTAEGRAAAELAEAQKFLNDALHQQAGTSVSDLARRAQELANAQKDVASRLKQMYGEQRLRTGNESSATLGGEGMPEMDDPNSPHFGYGYRRRFWQQAVEPRRPASEQENALAAEKDKLAQQVQQLQQEIQQEERRMNTAQPDASSKLRKALSDAEQKELALRMQKNAEWIRDGYGERNLGMEDSVTAGLEQLSRELRAVQEALKSGDSGGKNGQDDKSAQALSEVRALREQLEQRTEQADSQSPQGASAPTGDGSPVISGSGVQDAIQHLYALRSRIDPRDRALNGYIDGALGDLRHMTGAVPGVLDTRISQDAVASLERLELELSRRIGQQQAAGARITAPESSPEKYRDAVAEYFKKLSK